MKTVNLNDETWKRAKRAAVEDEVPLRTWVEQAVVLALEHGLVWSVVEERDARRSALADRAQS